MPNKNEVLISIADGTYSHKQVKNIIESIVVNDIYKPVILKKGDVIKLTVGSKPRPCIIINIKDKDVHYACLSTVKDHNYLMDANSRFYANSYVCKTIGYCSMKNALEAYINTYDNPSHLKEIIKEIKSYYKWL